ncbi:MAG: PilZ domain-containing protein [Desulfobacteraceae bacterium]|nr:PilZ domain-containing protein [Desulfobacteraceae bacterium]
MADTTGELRRLKRRHIIYYLEVFDRESGQLLGHLVDLTVKGMKLVSKEEIPVGKGFSLRMVMPEEYCPAREVLFHATSTWCSQDVNPDFFASGFSTPDLSEDNRRLFMILINQAGFND